MTVLFISVAGKSNSTPLSAFSFSPKPSNDSPPDEEVISVERKREKKVIEPHCALKLV